MAGYILIFLSGLLLGFLGGFGVVVYILNNKCSPETRAAIREECGA